MTKLNARLLLIVLAALIASCAYGRAGAALALPTHRSRPRKVTGWWAAGS